MRNPALFENKRILLVAAHPDDIESGCGGTISKYQNSGNVVRSVVFAPCLEDPLNAGIMDEFEEAMDILGVDRTLTYSFHRDILEQNDQQIRDILHELKVKFDPSIIFCPTSKDLHQDHRAIADCCFTIFRDSATLLTYELIRSTINFNPNLYVVLSEEDMKRKLKVLGCYRTQYRRAYFKPSIYRGMARLRGSQINCLFAEGFEVVRMTDKC